MIVNDLRTRDVLIFVSVIVVVVGVLTAAPVIADDDDPGPIPAAYYGDVIVDGDEPGTELTVEAIVDGEVRDSIKTVPNGTFGGPGAFDEKLTVEGAEGDDVTFQVQDEPVKTIEWESGVVEEVTLELDELPEEDTDDDDESGIGGADDGDDVDETDDGDDVDETDDVDEEPVDEEPVDDDPEETDEELELPEDVEPEHSEEAAIDVDEETGESQVTFSEESAVESISIAAETEGSVTVTEVDREPADTGPSPGASVSVTQIDVPEDAADSEATIRNRIAQERLDEIEADAEDLRVNRFDEDAGEWQDLPTEVVEETADGVVLEAETPGFSFFSVSAVGEPTAVIDAPAEIEAGAEATLDGGDSETPYGEIVAWEWTVDGEALTGETVGAAFEDPDEYTVVLTVENDGGETDTTETTLSVAEDPPDEDVDEAVDEDVDPESDEGLPMLWIGAGLLVVLVAIAAVLYARRDDSGGGDPLQ